MHPDSTADTRDPASFRPNDSSRATRGRSADSGGGRHLPSADHRRRAPARLESRNGEGGGVRPHLVRGPRCRRCSRARPGRDRRRDHRRPARNLGERAPSRGGTASSSAGDQAVARPASGKEETPMPGWMRTIDDFTLVKAAGAGFALTALNPKNVLLVAAAAAEIAEVGLSAGREIAVLAAFVILASLG